MSADIWVLDASAFVKLIKVEPESEPLQAWVRERHCVSSALLRAEARRAVLGEGAPVRRLCEERIASTHMVEVKAAVLDASGRLPGPNLRTLDAIYLATAMLIGDDLAGLVSYDSRQLAAAESLGIATASPGASEATN